jgi:hypothetical protein
VVWRGYRNACASSWVADGKTPARQCNRLILLEKMVGVAAKGHATTALRFNFMAQK